MNAAEVSRDDILAVLRRIVNLRWRGIKDDEVQIRRMGDRLAVLLPAAKFTDDEGIKLNGKFQHLMTQRGAHAFLDFVEGEWKGDATTLDGGFH